MGHYYGSEFIKFNLWRFVWIDKTKCTTIPYGFISLFGQIAFQYSRSWIDN